MDSMVHEVLEYFLNLEPMLLIYWVIALVASFIFLIQTILVILGLDGGADFDADFDGNLEGDSSFHWLSFRNIVNFMLGFGWAGVLLYDVIVSPALLVLASTGTGVIFVLMFLMIMQQFRKLEENNTFTIQKTLNKTAQVYLTIPAQKKGKGKILISVNGTTHELDALSESEAIETGAMVKVTRIIDNSLISVERI